MIAKNSSIDTVIYTLNTLDWTWISLVKDNFKD
jgi:hypothetical protein